MRIARPRLRSNVREEGSLSEEDFSVLSNGYSLLRSIDHNLRLIVGRSTRLPDPNHVDRKGRGDASRLRVSG